MSFKFFITPPETVEESIRRELVKEFEEGRRYHRARIGTRHYDELHLALFAGWPGGCSVPPPAVSPREPIRLATPIGTVTVVADIALAEEAFLETVPADVCREKAMAVRHEQKAQQEERDQRLQEPGRKEWASGGWVKRCEAAAAEGLHGMAGSIDISGPCPRREEVAGLIQGFIAAAAEDGFDARFVGSPSVMSGAVRELRMDVLWDQPLDQLEPGAKEDV